MQFFCPKCLQTREARAGETCPTCGVPLQLLLDERGALSPGFLAARGECCDTGCRNCPYPGDEDGGATQKICERCGVTFTCHPGGCWCDGVTLSPATLERLGREYGDCLCPACLSSFTSLTAPPHLD
jgi:hypothetical protein